MFLPEEDPHEEEAGIRSLCEKEATAFKHWQACGVTLDELAPKIKTWIMDGVTRDDDLALLIAACVAQLNARPTNLTHLREDLRFAR